MRAHPGLVCALAAAAAVTTACTGSRSTSAPSPSGPGGPASTTATTATPATPGASTPGASSGAPPQTPVAAESNPPGDIPDNLAFVPYRNAAGGYSFTHPEGWTRSETGASVTLTDKLNGVSVAPGALTAPPTVQSAAVADVPQLQAAQPAFELRTTAAASSPAGTGVRIVYRRNSAPDPVTGRVYRDEVERYELVSGGRELVMELYGPVGADNVDAYRTMLASLRAT